MNLKQKLEIALAEYESAVKYKTPEGEKFVINTILKAADELYRLAEEIRKNYHLIYLGRVVGDSFVVNNLLNELLAVGQRWAGILFLANLRDKVTTPIEWHFGVSFSGLRIWRQLRDKKDNKTVFVAYDGSRYGGGNYTLIKDGEMFFVTRNDFNTNYEISNKTN